MLGMKIENGGKDFRVYSFGGETQNSTAANQGDVFSRISPLKKRKKAKPKKH